MKARIIKRTTSECGEPITRYFVQYKKFLFWHDLVDCYDCAVWDYDEEKAKLRVKDILFKPQEEVCQLPTN